MPELAEIFRRYGSTYRERFGDRMLPSHRRALQDIADCCTETLGGHIFQCDQCGYRHYAYHSCRNRSCPHCHRHDTEQWLEERRAELLPVTYFHLVFTLPKVLHEFVRAHQAVLYNVLIQAAVRSLMHLARDPRYVGGELAVLCVLHTWTRALLYHPHVHCLVPSGGLSANGSWSSARNHFLVPVQALSEIFRAKFMELARKALPDVTFPESVWETRWVVYSKPSVQGAEKVLEYLARYIHRIAITNNRILSIDDEKITFRYKDSRENRWKTMTLPALEFIRRFLQHVLPQGFHKVRYYGLFSPTHRHLLQQVRELLTETSTTPEEAKGDDSEQAARLPTPEPPRCPACLIGHLVVVASLPRQGRAPP